MTPNQYAPFCPPTDPFAPGPRVVVSHDAAAVARDVYLAGMEAGRNGDAAVVRAGDLLAAYFAQQLPERPDRPAPEG